ncbi:MAG: hypothetical protein GY928_33905 [Colwellia sp.]|nr:hypothetical protein [Colwellia sp.]
MTDSDNTDNTITPHQIIKARIKGSKTIKDGDEKHKSLGLIVMLGQCSQKATELAIDGFIECYNNGDIEITAGGLIAVYSE